MGIWLKRLAILTVLGFPAAVLGKRLGIFGFRLSFDIIEWTLGLALLVVVLGLVLAFVQRRSNPTSARVSRNAAFLSLLPIVGIALPLVMSGPVPNIHNISTDTVNPPSFDQVVELRGTESNPLAYDAELLAPLQAQAYPEIKTLITSMDVSSAHQRALSVAKDLGWEIVASDAQAGLIEATETTFLWGFKDDVVIRIQSADAQTQIDLRSVSRVGQSDLGANAKRIAKFLDTF